MDVINMSLLMHTSLELDEEGKRSKLVDALQKQKGCFNPAWLPQLQLHCQGMYLQADKLTTTSIKFQTER